MSEVLPKDNARPQRSASSHRILAPDIARGLALLGIALANVATAWLTPTIVYSSARLGGIMHDSIWERSYALFAAMFVHVRGLPMFSTLLGYGVGMIVLSLWRREYPITKARAVVMRRYAFLALLGLIHMVFLFWGDIMFFYGVAGVLFALIITLKDKFLWMLAGLLAVLSIFFTLGSTVILPFLVDIPEVSLSSGAIDFSTKSYGEYVLLGLIILVAQFAAIPSELMMLMPVMIVGFIAARHRVLSRVDEFKKPLWIAVAVFLAIALLIGLPWGLAEIGVLPNSYANTFYYLNQAFGPFSGPGIVAVVALAVQPLQRRLDQASATGQGYKIAWPVRMVAALGARSMSGYVAQSLIFLVLTQKFTLGVGIGGGILVSAAIAGGVWLFTLLGAFALELAHKRGPFEAAHRYLAYGKEGLQDPYVSPQRALN